VAKNSDFSATGVNFDPNNKAKSSPRTATGVNFKTKTPFCAILLPMPKKHQKSDAPTSVIRVNPKGFGFIEPEEGETIFVPPGQLETALDNDIVVYRRTQGDNAKIVKIIKRHQTKFTGNIIETEDGPRIKPDNSKFYTLINPANLTKSGAKLNDKILIEISDWPKSEKEPTGNILKVFGQAGEHEPEMLSIIYDRGIEADFPEEVIKESEEILRQSASDLHNSASRRDFRDVVTFTIDPKSAKDYDDALSFQQISDDTFMIGVHIADVSFYVRPGTAIDDEAQKRATSVYLVDRTIPMLPEVLSNDLCSLVEGEDRLAYSAVFTLNKKAEIIDEWFGRTIINSNKRFTYENVEQILNEGQGQYFTELDIINKLAKELDRQKIRDGALAFEEDEVSFEIDDDGKPISVFKKERLASHKLVEDFMLLANKRVAEFASRFVRRKDLMFVYRIHEGPNPDKIADLIKFLKLFGHQLKIKGKKIVPAELNNFLKTIAGKPEEDILNRAIIRSMSRAVYATKNIGHFGLAFEDYTHFTSPIRRYPDIMVHRLLSFYLAKKYPPLETLQAYDRLCTHSSDREKMATDAERESIKYKQAEYLEQHLGEVFDGVVSGTTKWGMYVEELSTGAEGLVRLADLKDDHYTFDEKKFRLIGEKTKKTYRLGDTLKIKVLKTNRVAKTIDFGIVG